jgi:hypothetical protein
MARLSAHLHELGMTEAALRKAVKVACRTGKWPEYVRVCMEDKECLEELLAREAEECPEPESRGVGFALSSYQFMPLIPRDLSRERRIASRFSKAKITEYDLSQAANIGDESAHILYPEDPDDMQVPETFDKYTPTLNALMYVLLSFDWSPIDPIINDKLLLVYDDLPRYASMDYPSHLVDVADELRMWLRSGSRNLTVDGIRSYIDHLLRTTDPNASRGKLRRQSAEARDFLMRTWADFLVGEKTEKDLHKVAKWALYNSQ